jgi:hypothetical protein
VNRRKKDKPDIAARVSAAPSIPLTLLQSAGDPVEELQERKALAVPPPPDDHLAQLIFGATMTDQVRDLFERRLAPKDLTLWNSEEPLTLADSRRIYGLLDKTIIELAQTFGWRIYASEAVRQQMAKWFHGAYEHGPELVKQLGDAVHLGALVAHGRAKLPVMEREWREIKRQAVSESRRLIRQSRKIFNQRRTGLRYQEACEWLRKTIQDSPTAFPLLLVNIDSLFQFFTWAEKDDCFAQSLTLGNIPPVELFNRWGAFVRNLSPETFRQSISKLPASKL